ncbi:MAG: hypothetical protein Kow0060_00520 [Methylohalobius crimeensis]
MAFGDVGDPDGRHQAPKDGFTVFPESHPPTPRHDVPNGGGRKSGETLPMRAIHPRI